MITKKEFRIIETLPWLKSPRILFSFETKKEAEEELYKMNKLVLSESNFQIVEIECEYVFGIENSDIARPTP